MYRDKYGIIVQDDGYLDKETGYIYDDGGDSAFSTGLSAFGGSIEDARLMPLFIQFQYNVDVPARALLVRHPYQDHSTGTHPHNDPRATSRDQLMAFAAGYTFAKWYLPLNERMRIEIMIAQYAYAGRINNDILSPSDIAYLLHIAEDRDFSWLSHAWFFVEILLMRLFNPKHEKTQLPAKAYVFGEFYVNLLYFLYKDLDNQIREYFYGRRGRGQIAEGIINKLLEKKWD